MGPKISSNNFGNRTDFSSAGSSAKSLNSSSASLSSSTSSIGRDLKWTPSGPFADLFLDEALSLGKCILPQIEQKKVASLQVGESIRFFSIIIDGTVKKNYRFEVSNTQEFSSPEEMLNGVGWKELVPWSATEQEAKTAWNTITSGFNPEKQKIIAVWLKYLPRR